MNPVQLNTTKAATDTIQYVATLPAQAGAQSGLTATSTRTVLILPAQAGEPAPSIVPTDPNSSTTTAAIPTAQ